MIDTINLDLLYQYGVKKLHDTLSKLNQEKFPDEYRLVIEYNTDTINNSDYPGVQLTELIKILATIDFPVFFVIIQTNYENINRDLKHLDSIYHNGVCQVNSSTIEFIVKNTKLDTFCVLPWMHFYFNPQGQLNPCCDADNNYPLGNFRGSVDFNSESIQQFRQTLLDGKFAPQCTNCYKKEENKIPSLRQFVNQKFAKHIPINPTAQVENFKLRYLDIRLSNLCNLQCRMCSGKFSSRIAVEDNKIWGTTEYLYSSNSQKYTEKFVNIVKENIDSIERIYFAGGEPLIDDFHYDILNLLIEHKRTDIEIFYNTNFSIIDRALLFWPKFDNVTVGASIDLFGVASDYVRNGVDYQTLESNYFKLKENSQHTKFKINSIVNLYNVFNLCDLQKHWISDIGLPVKDISFNIMISPEYSTVRVLPEVYKQRAREKIVEHCEYLKSVGAKSLVERWQNTLHYMTTDHSHLLNSFFDYNNIKDKFRNQKFEDYFPEYQNLRNYAKST
jgi:organic radical activating enzyme